MPYYRKKGTTTILTETGEPLTTTEDIQRALKTVNYDLGKFPIYGENQKGTQTLNAKPRVSRYQKEAKTYYEGLDRTPPTPDEEAKIREEMRKAVQAQIDAIEKAYKDMLAQERVRGQERLGMTRAMAAAGGLLGSPMGEAQRQKTVALNKAQEQALQSEKQAKIAAILAKADERAERKIELEKAKAEAAQIISDAKAEAETLKKNDGTAEVTSAVVTTSITTDAPQSADDSGEHEMNEKERIMALDSVNLGLAALKKAYGLTDDQFEALSSFAGAHAILKKEPEAGTPATPAPVATPATSAAVLAASAADLFIPFGSVEPSVTAIASAP